MSGIRVELELNDGSFTTRMIHAGETVAQFNRNVGQTYTSITKLTESHRDLLSTLRDVSVLFGTMGAAMNNVRQITTGWMGDIIKTNAEMQRTQALLQGMSKAANPVRDAADQLAYLRDMAKSSPFALQDLTKTFVQLKATGIDPMKGAMNGLVDAVAAMGGTPEKMNRAALAMSQMSGKGVVQMEELRQQLGEAVPRAAELMARSMGVTYGELIKAVSTGTVEAKAAIELLNLELSRTFGGAAADRMDTFDGLIAQLGTSFQDLQLKAGKAGFFDAVQKQIKDLVAAMNSPQFGDFATRLGAGLTSFIGIVRSTFNAVAQFKDEIYSVGEAIVIAFAVSRSYAAFAAISTGLGAIGVAATAAKLQLNLLTASVAGQMGPAMAGSATMMGSLIASTGTLGVVARGSALAMGGLAIAVGSVMPFLPLIAGAVMLAVEAWSRFSDQTAKAREELIKFGATSKQAVADAFDSAIVAQTDKLKEAEAKLAYMNKRNTGPLYAGQRTLQAQEVEKERAALTEMVQQRSKLMLQGQAAEDDKISDALVKAAADRQKIRARDYDADGIAAAKAQDAEIARLTASQQSITAAKKNYQDESRRRARAFYEDELKDLDDQITKQLEIAMRADPNSEEFRQARNNAAALTKPFYAVQAKLAQFDETAGGVPTTTKIKDEEKAAQKIRDLITSTTAATIGMRAELAGASSEAAKVLYELNNSSKVPKNNPVIEQLKVDLEEAILLNDKLQKELQGKKDFDRDIESALKRTMEERFEAEHKGISESEKIRLKASQGAYGALTNQTKGAQAALDSAAGAAGALATALTSVQAAGLRVDEALDKAFGGETKTAIEAADAVIKQIIMSLERLKSLSTGLNLSESFTNLDASKGVGANQQGAFGLGGVTTTLTGQGGKDLDLAVRTILAEASGEGNTGMQAVAEVMRNRATRSGQSLSQVVTAPQQFSPWNNNKGRADMMAVDANSPKYQNALRILQQVMASTDGDITNGATSFANPGASDPVNQRGWIAKMTNKKQIGNHLFGEAGYGGRSIDRQASNLPPEQENQRIGVMIEESKTKLVVAQKALDEQIATFDVETQNLLKNDTKTGAAVKAIRAQIQKGGSMNPDNLSVDDDSFKTILAAAQRMDDATKKVAESDKLRGKAKTAQEQIASKLADANERLARSNEQAKDPYSYKRSDAYMTADSASRKMFGDAAASPDEEGGATEAKRQAYLNTMIQADLAQRAAAAQKEADIINQGLQTEFGARSSALANRLRLIDSELAAYTEAGGKEVAAVAGFENQKAALRKQAFASGPLAQQMRGFADIGNNLEKSMTGWISGFSDQFAEMITTGKADFASLAQSMIKDIVKLGIQWAASSLFKSFMGGGGGLGAAAGGEAGGGIMGSLGSIFGGLFGSKHTGGIVGGAGATRNISALAFAGAPKFHTGGIVGGAALGLKRGEVPIVAKEGEGVFTQEQMAAMGSMGSSSRMITIAPTIQVNANGGNPAQNADLAAQTAKAAEGVIRGIVVKEMMQQSRPGNMFG